VNVYHNLQGRQASKSNESATDNRSVLVGGQVPAREVCENTRRDVIVCHQKRVSQASKSRKSPSEIDVILSAFKFLHKDKYEITVLTRQSRAEYNQVKLKSPVNASIAIDVILFVCMV
jgi:hypothetical protein